MVICLVLLYQSFNQLFALELLKRCGALGATALIMAVIAYCLTASLHNPWLLIASRLAIACTLYVVALKLMHAQILNESIAFLRSKILKK